MKGWKKNLTLLAILLAGGALRLPFEAQLTKDLRQAGLIVKPLQIGTREKIGQTSSAVALGGLRTLVATFLNLRAFTAFTEYRWGDVEEIYDTIVDLAPHTRYYWWSGSNYMAYDAAPYSLYNEKLTPVRRRYEWQNYILKGESFLRRGLQNNPDDPELHRNLGSLLSDPNKIRAFPDTSASFLAASQEFQIAADSGKMLPIVRRLQLYSLARVPGHEAEALTLAQKLYDERLKNRSPSLLCLLIVLETHQGLTQDPAKRAVELFGDEKKAYKALGYYWRDQVNYFPMDGIASALKTLETALSIPEEKSILHLKMPPRFGTDEWFN